MSFLIFLTVYIRAQLYRIPFKRIPVILALLTGMFYLTYTAIDVQSEAKKDNHPKKIAHEINRLLPQDTRTVYEIGYRRFLGTTCYLTQEIVQIDTFSALKSLQNRGNKIYFIFDTKFLSSRSDEEQKIFAQEIQWEQLYSKYYNSSRERIVVGCLKDQKD